MTIQEGFKKIEVFKKVNPASITNLLPYARLRSFHKGETLFVEKDEGGSLFFLVDGIAALYKLHSNGDKRTVFIYGAGALLNEMILDYKPVSINAEALRDSQVLCLNRSRFLSACARDFGLSKAVMDTMTLQIRRLYRLMKNTALNVRGDKRIVARLWKLSRDFGRLTPRGTEIDFDLTITQFAELLGAQRETISRQIQILSKQGIIILDKKRFIIPDRDKLLQYFSSPS
ncbi:MAG: Crp/Fnr family transcriptional regulator [Spirochaetaceae bacterium]|jgi:CRP-like cAMP-binding protein|nr:Crp/Fnr family transcriptional regulator [Spirochaetaceae bacterium]